MKRSMAGISMAMALSFAGGASAIPMELITNGGFETGDFTGWTATDLTGGSGSWFVDSVATTPVSSSSTVGPASGGFYAVTDQGGPGTHALEQAFTVPVGVSSLMLSFDMFMNDQSAVGPLDAGGLDHNLPLNQHARVDILTALAGTFSVSVADIVDALVAPSVDPGPNPHAYKSYLFDLLPFVTGGTTYKLRFAEVDNQLFFNQGVDNVSLLADARQSVPEPTTLALLSISFAGFAYSRRRARGCEI